MPRLTSSTNGKGNASQRKAVPASQPQEASEAASTTPKGKAFSFTFDAPAGHVSTGKTLVVFKGRGKGGVDMYVPLSLIAKELGFLPEGAEITVSVKAKGKAVANPVVAVPKTSQHLFDKGEEHTWEDVYGGSFAEHMRALKVAKPEEPRKAAQGPRRVPGDCKNHSQADADNAKANAQTGSLADARLDRLESMMEKLAKAVMAGK